jgi:hypothetical protein
LIHRRDRGLVQHHAFALHQDQGVGRAQVHRELAGGSPDASTARRAAAVVRKARSASGTEADEVVGSIVAVTRCFL